MSGSIAQKIEKALGAAIVKSRALRGGDIADVSLITVADGREFVAKRPRMDQPDTTAIEKMMLGHLVSNSSLPVPKVQFQTRGLIILDYVPHKGVSDPIRAAEDAAHHVAALHRVQTKGTRGRYGFTKDTFIGPLVQQNKSSNNWVDFFRDNRLLAMAQSSHRVQRLSLKTLQNIEKLSVKLSNYLPSDPEASLLHGDLWAGNILIDGDSIAAFIDPAISYGHSEMDLAFIDLMGGLDPAFFKAYEALRPLDKGFWEERRYLYQLWPLLVHVRLFGGGYTEQVDAILARFL